MPPRILIFVALSGDGPRAAAGAACDLVPAGSARPLSLAPASIDAAVRRTADRLAENLDLRPVAGELAMLARITQLVRERPDATIVIDADAPATLIALVEAADLARARLDGGRPAAGVSTLAADRAGATPGLAVLQAAAAAGDLLRAPELASVGLVPGPHPTAIGLEQARIALALAGTAVLPRALPDDPVAAARALLAAGGPSALTHDPAAVISAQPGGAEVSVPLPAVPDDLRAVRSGAELALHAAGTSRRLRAPSSLGPLVPGDIAASDDGTVLIAFMPAAQPGA